MGLSISAADLWSWISVGFKEIMEVLIKVLICIHYDEVCRPSLPSRDINARFLSRPWSHTYREQQM